MYIAIQHERTQISLNGRNEGILYEKKKPYHYNDVTGKNNYLECLPAQHFCSLISVSKLNQVGIKTVSAPVLPLQSYP